MALPKPRDPNVLEVLREFHPPQEVQLWYDQYEKAYRGRERAAPHKGIRFQLSKNDFWKMVYRARGACEITRQPFDRYEKGVTGKRPFIPTIDRLSPTGHYTRDNCELLTWIANVAISDFGRRPFLDMIEHGAVSPALEKHLKQKELGIPSANAFDNILPFIRDSSIGRLVARHLFAASDEEDPADNHCEK